MVGGLIGSVLGGVARVADYPVTSAPMCTASTTLKCRLITTTQTWDPELAILRGAPTE